MTVPPPGAPAPNASARSRRTTLSPIPGDYERLEHLFKIQAVLSQASSIELACDELLPIVAHTIGVRTVVVLEATPQVDQTLTWAPADVSPTELDAACETASRMFAYLAPGRPPSATVVTRASILVGGAPHATFPRHVVTLPMAVLHGRVFGVFQIQGAIALDERDLLFINAVATTLAIAFERRHVQLELERARAEVEQANRQLTDLHAISAAALEGHTLDESLTASLRAMCPIFDTDMAAVLQLSADGNTLQHQVGVGLEGFPQLEVPFEAFTSRSPNGTALLVYDDEVCPEWRACGVRSILVAPIHARNRVIGIVCVGSREPGRFTGEELRFLQAVADRIGMIIDNVVLYERALAAIRARDVVMGVVSHDLRNPLSTIRMSMELLTSDHPNLGKRIGLIQRSIEMMFRLIDDLGDVNSIEAGQLSLTNRAEDGHALIHQAIEAARSSATKKGIRVRSRSCSKVVPVICDRIRVIQVLGNALANAVKFTPEGGLITVSVARAKTGFARFSVQDTGCGIRKEDLHRVFERYWQAPQTAHLGTGLGLAIAKGIVEGHGGTMSIESEVGRGTTLTFTLPLATAPPPA